MRVLDRSQMGYRILQDHRPGQEPSKRLATGAVRIVDHGTGLTREHVVGEVEGHHTYGDDHPYRFWQGGGRGFGSWSPAFAAESQGDGGSSESQVSYALQYDGSTRRVERSSSDADEDVVVTLLPMRRSEYVGDGRYAGVGHKVLDWMPTYPKGYHLIGMAGTDERSQQNLMLSGDPRLIAPHRSGPDRAGTIVTDLDTDGSIQPQGPYGIGGRAAPLQTHLRVVRLPKVKVLGNEKGNVAAWVGTLTGQGDMLGGAAYWGPEDKAAPQADTVHPASPKTGGASGPTTPSTTDPNAASGPSFQNPAGAVTPSNSTAPAGTQPLQPGDGQFAMFDWHLHGPMKVGSGKQDKHALPQRTEDGESMSSGHIGTTALYHMDTKRDAPLAFNRFPYPNVDIGPFPYKVFLSYEKRVSHEHFGQQVPGLWDWWTAIPMVTGGPPKIPGDTTPGDDDGDDPRDTPTTGGGEPQTAPDEPPPPPPPPPPGPPPTTPDTVDPGDQSGGGDGPDAYDAALEWARVYGDKKFGPPSPPPPPPRPAVGPNGPQRQTRGRPGGEPVGYSDPSGSDTLAGRLVELPSLNPGRRDRGLMIPGALGLASSSWRPQTPVDGMVDYRHAETFDGEQSKAELVERPQVLRTEAWGHIDGTRWVHVEDPYESRNWGGTALGGVLRMPPEREILEYRDSEPDHPGTYRYDTFADGVALAWGAPDFATGGLRDGGWRTVRDADGDLVTDYFSSAWGTIVRLSVSDREVTINLDGAINIPTGADAGRPSAPATGALRFNDQNTELEAYSGSAWLGASFKAGMSVIWNTAVGTPAGWSTDATLNSNVPPGTGYSWITRN